MQHPLHAIAARRREIAAERADHLTALEALDEEARDLDVAERVFHKLSDEIGHASDPKSDFAGVALSPASTPNGKPPGTPTVPEMIKKTLQMRSLLEGTSGLTSKDMVEDIRKEWWPGVTSAEINPIAWRMAKRGELIKDGTLYRWPTPDAAGVVKVVPPDGDEPPEDEDNSSPLPTQAGANPGAASSGEFKRRF